jgi:RND family efflux transporter MFP subunit
MRDPSLHTSSSLFLPHSGFVIVGVAIDRSPPLSYVRRVTRPIRGALVFTLSLAAATVLGGCKKSDATPEGRAEASPAQSATPAVSATFAKVESRTVAPRLEVSGTLDPDERSEVASQTNGTVLSVAVDIGSRVKKGDVLVELDGREASLRLSAANATTEQQKARLGLDRNEKFDPTQVADVKAAADAKELARMELERAERLYKEGAISKSAFDQAKSAKERADAQYDMARNGAAQAYAAMQTAQSQAGLSAKSLDDTKIKAPFDGVVVEKRISAGEFASAGRVVVVIVRDDPLRLKFDVAEGSVGGLAIGQPVDLTVAAHPGKSFKGVVKRIGASVKVQSRTLPVEAEVPNAEGLLKPGFFAKALVSLTGEPKPALFVPRSALSQAATGQRVFVKKGDRVIERLVVVGASEGDLVEVSGQLAPGEEVAVDHLTDLTDGAAVM